MSIESRVESRVLDQMASRLLRLAGRCQRRRTVACIVVAVVAAVAGCAQPPATRATPSAATDAALTDTVRAFLSEFARLGAAAQWDSLSMFYDDAPGFSWVESGAVVARSRAEIRRGLDKVAAGMALRTTFDSLAVSVLEPTVAVVRSNTRTQYVDRVSGKPAFGFSTMLTLVLVRRADGWKMHQGHASSPGTHTTP